MAAWTIQYWDGSSWVTLAGAVDKIIQELNGHEEATFVIANNETNRNIVASDRKVKILYDSTVQFKGLLTAPQYGLPTIKCICYNECYVKMNAKDFTHEYTNVPASTILSDICAAAGVVAGSCPSGGIGAKDVLQYEGYPIAKDIVLRPLPAGAGISVRFKRAICWDAATFLARAVNADFWTDEDAYGNPRFNIGTRGSAKGSVTPISWPDRGVDRSKKRDKVVIRGVDADGNEIEGSAGTGTNVAVFTEKKASDTATLNNLAAQKLAELNKESSGVKLPINIFTAYNLFPGDTVTLNNSALNLVGDFRIWKVTKTIATADVEVDRPQNVTEKDIQQMEALEDFGIYPISAAQFVIAAGAFFPSTPSAGQVFFRTDLGKLFRYDGTNWVLVVQAGSGSSFPATAFSGELFYKTDENVMYRYNGTAWVSVHQISIHGATFPSSPKLGDFFYNTTDNYLYRWNGSVWQKVMHQSSGSSFPTSPEMGDTFYHTGYEQTFYYTGTEWIPLATVSRSGSSFPANKAVGDVFFRTDELKFYRWNGTSWILVSPEIISAPPENLVSNQSFEIDRDGDNIPDYWLKGGNQTTERITTDSFKGGACVRLFCNTGAGNLAECIQEVFIPIKPSTKYYAAAALKLVSGTNYGIVRVHWYTRTKAESSTPYTDAYYGTITSSWAPYGGVVTSPSDAEFAKVASFIYEPAANTEIRLDDFVFSEMRAAVPTNQAYSWGSSSWYLFYRGTNEEADLNCTITAADYDRLIVFVSGYGLDSYGNASPTENPAIVGHKVTVDSTDIIKHAFPMHHWQVRGIADDRMFIPSTFILPAGKSASVKVWWLSLGSGAYLDIGYYWNEYDLRHSHR
jgi:hypothetical protein